MDPVTYLFFFKLLFLQLTANNPQNSYFSASLSGRGSASITDNIEISANAQGSAFGRPSATAAAPAPGGNPASAPTSYDYYNYDYYNYDYYNYDYDYDYDYYDDDYYDYSSFG